MDQNRSSTPDNAPGKKKPGAVVLFFLVFAAVTALAWCLPLRPTVSIKEKRSLERFPDFSVAALADGSYFQQISLWFSDTFPGRDDWISADQSIKRLYGSSDIVIYGQVDSGDEIPTAPPTAAPAATPHMEEAVQTAAEETTPEPTAEPEAEEIVWGGKVIEDEELISAGTVIQIGDSVFDYTGFSQYYCDAYAANMNRAAEMLEGKCRVSSVFVLHAATLLLPREFREEMGCAAEEDILDYVNQNLDDSVIGVDTYTPLLEHNGEYIYFRTDHHWTALGAWYAYADWARKAGLEPVGLEEYREVVLEPFLGSLYYKANQSSRLRVDSVVAYVPPGDIHLYINDTGTDSHNWRGTEYALITDVKGTDKYAAFLLGDHGMCTFVNNDITDGSACVIVKNSNGNPFSYYFSQHYQYVYVLDYRKYNYRGLAEFVDYYGVDDVIFCISAGQAQSRGGNSLLTHFIR